METLGDTDFNSYAKVFIFSRFSQLTAGFVCVFPWKIAALAGRLAGWLAAGWLAAWLAGGLLAAGWLANRDLGAFSSKNNRITRGTEGLP